MKIIHSVLKIISVLLIVTVALNYAGFCWRRGVILSDNDYINIAVQNRLYREPSLAVYNNVAAFRSKHPNCCRVYRFTGDMTANWLFALFGKYRVYVTVVHPIISDSGIPKTYIAYVLVTACGWAGFEKGVAMHGPIAASPFNVQTSTNQTRGVGFHDCSAQSELHSRLAAT